MHLFIMLSFSPLLLVSLQDPLAFASCGAAAGLSLGEYSALVFAGAMSFEDGFKVRVANDTD
jgi:[acyl-carrier-protein] S-malonyltransferase